MAIERIVTPPRLPPRPIDAHKGSFGRVLVVAGSRGMSGAAVLCGSAALRGGAGLVKVAVPAEIQDIVAIGNPCYMTAGLGESALPELVDLAQSADVLAIGPGLGTSQSARDIVNGLIGRFDRCIVLDADGINALTAHSADPVRKNGPMVLTPHPGEFARLIGSTPTQVNAQREELAVRFAAEHHVVLVLKGANSLVTDGVRLYVNRTGNPGMATGGSGDVLTGLIAALVAQRLDPFDAAVLGTHLHGRAGDLARDELSEAAMIASDLLDFLPSAFVRFKAE